MMPRIHNAFLTLAACMVAVLLSNCANPVEGDEHAQKTNTLVNYHRTRHFVFFYDTSVYSKAEIESNGKAKEAHLKRLEAELGVTFDKEILVRLISESGANWAGQAYPREPYFIQETRNYFIRDNGHEIAHIVSFETMGFPQARFFVEGLAAAHELDDKPKWTRLCYSNKDSQVLFEVLKEMMTVGDSEKVDYVLAASYVEWLEGEFGMERFRNFYRDLSTFRRSGLSSLMTRNFGVSEDELHHRFISERYTMAIRSKYCGN